MILKNHNDGSCFKLKIEWMVDPGDGLTSEYIRYSEDPEELISHGFFKYAGLANAEFYIFNFEMKDDSK